MELINREISWLSFNERVLQEAEDVSNPLIERLRFLGIFSNNLDEFFRVRIASLTRLGSLGKKTQAKLFDDPKEILTLALKKINELQKRRDLVYSDIKSSLADERIDFISHTEIPESEAKKIQSFFYEELRPKLVPLMLSQVNGIPDLVDGEAYLFCHLKLKNGDEENALIEVPSSLSRFYVFESENRIKVLFLEDIIRYRLNKIFRTLDVKESSAYMIKVTRDAELDLDDDYSKSILQKMEKSVKDRKRGVYVRLLYDADLPEDLLGYLTEKLNIQGSSNVIAGGKYHNKKDLISFPDLGRSELVYKPNSALRHRYFKGRKSLFSIIKNKDILLHVPYQRFDYITAFLREAAIDPNVKSISISLYRVSKDSDIVHALVNAAQNGKKVNVIMELQARFDEENNIKFSDILTDAGAEVMFSNSNLKVHSKIILIQSKKGKNNEHYGFVGTGNFHEKNAKIYEDVGVFTSNKLIIKDLKKIFSLFENSFQRAEFGALVVSPFDTRDKFSELIINEIKNAQNGSPAEIILKMNNLVDKEMIYLLYEASKKNVKIRLLIRGICTLVPGISKLSENIEVRSIVGRYLEHSRILYFANGGEPKIFISSADWMTRNLNRRLEVSLPIFDEEIAKQLHDYLELLWSDNTKSRILDKDLRNLKVGPVGEKINAQTAIYEKLVSDLKPLFK